MFAKSFAVAALAVSPVLADYAVNVYWGQTGTDRLSSYCDSDGFEYITLAFVNNSPEQDQSGLDYPGTNFGSHCGAAVYSKNGVDSKLRSSCTEIAQDIPYCQSKGKKVILSIGGEPNQYTDYTLSSVTAGRDFATFLWGAFGPYNATFDGPRPFDTAGTHVSVDGFDFDIEVKFDDQSPYVAMITQLRQYFAASGGNYLITGAPQCPLSDQYFQMKTIITDAIFDILWIQFYNNKGCDAIPNNDDWPDAFNFDAWQTFIATTASAGAKLFIGLPGSSGSAGSGYLDPDVAYALMQEYQSRPSFGGAMVWDVTTGSAKTPNGRTYYEHLHDALFHKTVPTVTVTTTTATSTPSPTATVCVQKYTVQSGDYCYKIATDFGMTTDALRALNPALDSTTNPECLLQIGQVLCVKTGAAPTSTTTTTTSSTTTTSTTTSTSSTTTTSTSTTATTETDTETTTTTSTSTTATTETDTETATTTSTSRTTTSSTASTTETSSSTAETSATETSATETSATETSATETSATETSATETSATETSATETSATETSATETSGTETSATGTSSSATETYATGTSASATETYATETSASATESYPTGTSASTTETGGSGTLPTGSTTMSTDTSTAQPTSWTTSTVSTTTTYTVTSCAETVTNCPLGHVTTETIPWYTTVCPVTETETPAGPTVIDVTATVVPATSSAAAVTQGPSMTTSTVYSTTIYTVTKCPATVTNCPLGHVTTEIVPVYTTVCPVTETPGGNKPAPTTTPVLPKPTGGAHDVYPSGGSEQTTTTKSTSTAFTTVVLPTKAPTTSAGSGSNSTIVISYSAPTTLGSTASASATKPASTTKPAAVTAGAARNAIAFGLPAVMAAVVLAL